MKKVLLIGLRYHTYTDEIVWEIERLGFQVTFYDILPRTLFYKSLPFVSKAAFRSALDRYHEQMLSTLAGRSYDVVLFIQAHHFSAQNMEALKRQNSGAQFIFYTWDALTTHDYRVHLPVFDTAFTFDRDDAIALGISYLPLFCIRAFQNLAKVRQDENIVYFVGSIVSVRRYEALLAFEAYCRAMAIQFHQYRASTPPKLARLILNGYLPRNVSLSPLAQSRFIEMIQSATTVFDFANHEQSGYTMRVIENLCAGKKIITNNSNILHEPFCTPDRIHVFRDFTFEGVGEFLTRKIEEPCRTFAEFHVQSFVRRLLADAPGGP